MDDSHDEHHDEPSDGQRRYIWFAVALAAVVLVFAAISITVVAMTPSR